MRSLSASRKIYFLMPKHLRWYQRSLVSHATLSDLTALWHWPQGYLMVGPGFCSTSPAIIKRRLINIRDFCLWCFFLNLLPWVVIHIKSNPDGFQLSICCLFTAYASTLSSEVDFELHFTTIAPIAIKNHMYARIFDAAGRVILVEFRSLLSIISGVSISALSVIGGLSKYQCFFK